MSAIKLEWGDWEKVVQKPEGPVVVEFWHENCPTCKKIEPQVKELPAKLAGKATLARMNVLESRENRVLAIQKGVIGTPTFKVYCRGAEVGELVGGETLTDLSKKLEEIVGKCVKSA